MKHRSCQWLPTRLPLAVIQTRFCWAIGLASLIISAGLLPPSALAHGLPIPSSLSRNQTVLAGTPTPATVQAPPAVINRLRQDLSKQTKLPAAKLKVVEATAKTWPNGCLGLAKADEMCTEALVSGWRVVFSSGNRRWTYRADKQARLYRLEPKAR